MSGLSTLDALRTLALEPKPRGCPIGALWFYEEAPFPGRYGEGVRVRHLGTGQTGTVVSTRGIGGGELYVLVRWDDVRYPPNHCDVYVSLPRVLRNLARTRHPDQAPPDDAYADEVLEITGPPEPDRAEPERPQQLELGAAT